MSSSYDILIAGAGPAGCAAAYDLAQGGLRVLLLDRRTFPRPKACACGLTRKTLKALRYSVDPVVERVCHEIVLQHGAPSSVGLSAADPMREVRVRTRTPICAMAVRERFDAFCLQQTLATGRNGGRVSLLKTEAIRALRELQTHVELDLATAEGTLTLQASVLIGADGSNGQTRRLEAALRGAVSGEPAWYSRGFALEATVPYAALPAQLPAGDAPHDLIFDFAPLPGGYGWLFPKGDHINIGVGAFAPSAKGDAQPGRGMGAAYRASELRAGIDDQEASLKQVTRALLSAYLQQKLGVTALPDGEAFAVSGQHLGMGGHAYAPRGRVLLVGDAAGLVDPLTGEGIHSAIVSGQAAAAAILSCSDDLPKDVGAAYARALQPLQQTLAFSERAARAFYREPERGFRAMRLPMVRSLILKTYADGLPHTRLLTAIAKLV